MQYAACRGKDPNLWFPERGASKASNEAKLICFECKVRKQCDEYADRTDSTDGIWGGASKTRSSD